MRTLRNCLTARRGESLPWFVVFVIVFYFRGVGVPAPTDLSQDITECWVGKRCMVPHLRDAAATQNPKNTGNNELWLKGKGWWFLGTHHLFKFFPSSKSFIYIIYITKTLSLFIIIIIIICACGGIGCAWTIAHGEVWGWYCRPGSLLPLYLDSGHWTQLLYLISKPLYWQTHLTSPLLCGEPRKPGTNV